MTEISRMFIDQEDKSHEQRARNLKKKFGPDILVCIPYDQSIIELVKKTNVNFQCYSIGPGIFAWSEKERNLIKKRAKRAGFDLGARSWIEQWFEHGWVNYTNQECIEMYRMGCYSHEVRNVHYSGKLYTEWFINHLQSVINGVGDDIKARAMIRNVDEVSLEGLVNTLLKEPKLSKHLLKFAIFEPHSGDPEKQISLCSRLNIKAITSISGLKDDGLTIDENGITHN